MNVQILPEMFIFKVTHWLGQCSTQKNDARMWKYQALFSFLEPSIILKLVLAGYLVTNEPGEVKTKPTNQTKLAKKGKTFYFTYTKGANWVLSSPDWRRGILKDHICVFHGALGNGLLWDNIKARFHSLQRRLLPP